MSYVLYDTMKRRIDNAFALLRAEGHTAHQNYKANPRAASLALSDVERVVFYSNDEHQKMRESGRVLVYCKGLDSNIVAAIFRRYQLHVRVAPNPLTPQVWSWMLVQNDPFPVEQQPTQQPESAQPRVNWQPTDEAYEGRMYLH